jgi:ABC-type transport system involved in multi-copper enzyme maturation permease subunit
LLVFGAGRIARIAARRNLMPLRFGPGPVFIHESIAATRRWQMYALRALFVFGLLLGLAAVLLLNMAVLAQPMGSYPIHELAELGESFYYAIATVQLGLVLLVAPAATAGTICADRASGTLTHMLVTDLTCSEIVLGKLAARLVPVFGLVAATVPVLALAGLLGGVIIEAIATLTLITLATAVLGCALALAFSVRVKKVHEALTAVYAIESVWIIGPLVWAVLNQLGVPIGPPAWFTNTNPFVLIWAPYAWPNTVGIEVYLLVPGAALLISAGLVAYAVLRLRADAGEGTRRRTPGEWSWFSGARTWLDSRRLRPSLDSDPLLWHEWRRGRPSRLTRIVWGCYAVLALAGTCWSVVRACNGDTPEIVGLLSGLQATLGLLLVSMYAPTALAEERARGSLQVLMTTPISTDRIVLAKWWGAYRPVPALAFLPALGALAVGFAQPESPVHFRRVAQSFEPLGLIDRVAFMSLPTALFLAQGAVVTSLGLALATCLRRTGRAIAVSAAVYAFITAGWFLLLEGDFLADMLSWLGLAGPGDNEGGRFFLMITLSFCPLGAQITPFLSVDWNTALGRYAFYAGHLVVLLFTIGVALLFLGLTLATFNRAIGRMPERSRRAPRPPRRARAVPAPHSRRVEAQGDAVARLAG